MSEPVTRIGKYQIIEQVGEGAMGVVYKAIDPVLNRPVAVKVMNEGMAQDEALRERFLREAQAAGSLQHPNVVTIYDFGETDGHLFIAMEFIQGSDLEQLMARKSVMPLVQKLDIIIDVLNGLAYAHRRGLVHRDIKPANIRIDSEGHARIMDFGVVHMASSNLTGTGIMMGTPNYMAPENITGSPVTAASDIFSVGAVMFELLTNKKPFEADTLHRVLFRIVSDPPPELLDEQPDLPPALDKIIKKSLAKELEDRYANANEMANEIAAVRATLGSPRASRTVSQRSSIEQGLKLQREHQSRTLARWRMFGTGTAAMLAIGVIGFLTYRLNQGDAPASQVASSTPSATPAAGDTARPLQSGAPLSGAAGATAAAAVGTTGRPATRVDSSRESVGTGTQTVVPRQEQRVPAANTPVRQPRTTPDTTRRLAAARDAGPTAPTQSPTSGATTQASPPVASNPAPAGAGQVTQPQATAAISTLPVRQDTAAAIRAPAVPAPPPENPRVAITSIVTAYARAIGTRDVGEVRRVYTGMTPAQASAWESFFSSVRSMTANFEISGLEVSGATAIARLTGAYEFVNRTGRTERQPASFTASFARDAEQWKLVTIK